MHTCTQYNAHCTDTSSNNTNSNNTSSNNTSSNANANMSTITNTLTITNNCTISYSSYLKFHIQVDGWAIVVEAEEGVARDVDPVLHDPVRHLPGQVEDGVLVGLDGLGGVDDEDERGVERTIGGLTKSALGRLRARLAPGAKYLHNHYKTNNKHQHSTSSSAPS